jgi:hypothetical protein
MSNNLKAFKTSRLELHLDTKSVKMLQPLVTMDPAKIFRLLIRTIS